MGMFRIRDELEDLSFQVLNFEARELIKKRLDEIKENRSLKFKNISNELTDILTGRYCVLANTCNLDL